MPRPTKVIATIALGVFATFLACVGACAGAHPSTGTTTSHLTAGDGATDDRPAIQALLDAGQPIVLPNGVYTIGQGSGTWGLSLPAGARLCGETRTGVILRAKPGLAAYVRLVDVAGTGVTVCNLTIDGNKGSQVPDEHRHGLMSRFADTLVDQVTSINSTGDGFYAYTGAERFTIRRSEATGNDRNGATLSGQWDHGLVEDNYFHDNRAQQLDSEASLINFLVVRRNTISKTGGTDHLFTVSGRSPTERSHHWSIYENTVGSTHMGWVEDIDFRRNICVSDAQPCVSVYRTNTRIVIEDNQLTMTRTTMPNTDLDSGAVNISGTAEGGPARVLVASNRIVMAAGNPDRVAVRMMGLVSAAVVDNDIVGTGVAVPGGAGIAIRATDPSRPIEGVVVRGNRIRDFGQFGVSVTGNGAAVLKQLTVSGNTFDDQAGAMTIAVSLDDGTGALKAVSVVDNDLSGKCTIPVFRVPVGAVVFTSQRGM